VRPAAGPVVALSGWQEYSAALAHELAWPVVAVVAVALFRKPLVNLLGNIESARWGDKEVKFNLKDLEAQAKKVVPRGGAFRDVGPTESKDLLKLAKEHPRAGILEGWVRFERSLKDAVRRLGGTLDQRRPIHSAIDVLRERSDLPEDFFDLVEELRRIRNQVVHGDERPGMLEDASAYVRTAARLARAVEDAGPRHR
jgi:hypothetical protein